MSKNGKLLFRNYDPYITSPFGYRINPVSGVRALHAGVDYGTNDKNIPTYGIDNGVVVKTGFQKALGNYVYVNYPKLNHGALYQHLDSIKVSKGEKVTKDTVIGITGATGEVTGIHLHFGWFPSSDVNKDWYSINFEDYEKYVFPMEIEVIGKPVIRDETKDQIEVIINNLYARNNPNGNILGYIKEGIYNILDSKVDGDYTWYKIDDNYWIAYTDTYAKLYKKKEEVEEKEEKEEPKEDLDNNNNNEDGKEDNDNNQEVVKKENIFIIIIRKIIEFLKKIFKN